MERSNPPPRKISDRQERPLVLRSMADRPVTEMTQLEQSLLMAELAMVAYNDPDEARRAAASLGFPDLAFYERDGSQAYRFRNQHDCVIACRGTEASEWNDIRADVRASSVLSETVGRVHRGFKREVDDLWPMLETALMCNRQPLWFCGHSLGGAMATICAGRCLLSHIDSNPERLFSFGSPRVGNPRYTQYTKLDHLRYVNNNDIVTRVPPGWFGYRHCGSEIYLDRRGQIRKSGFAGKTRDCWIGFCRGLLNGKIDPFEDHSIHQYISVIAKARAEESQSESS
ncbi:MAG: lipase family protein, partial [Rubripirellula sp.]